MLIRSQDRTILVDTKTLVINDKATIVAIQSNDFYCNLGTYDSHDEAVAVLDDIQKRMQADVYPVYEMPLKGYYLLYVSKLKLGKKLTSKLRRLGIRTIGDIINCELLENYDDALTDEETEAIKEALKKYE